MGLIILSLLMNILPMFLIASQDRLSEPMKWGASMGYLILALFIVLAV